MSSTCVQQTTPDPAPTECSDSPLLQVLLHNSMLFRQQKGFSLSVATFQMKGRKAIATKKEHNHPRAFQFTKKLKQRDVFLKIALEVESVGSRSQRAALRTARGPVAGNI